MEKQLQLLENFGSHSSRAAAAAFAAYLQLKEKFDIGANVMGVTARLHGVENGWDGKFWELERIGNE